MKYDFRLIVTGIKTKNAKVSRLLILPTFLNILQLLTWVTPGNHSPLVVEAFLATASEPGLSAAICLGYLKNPMLCSLPPQKNLEGNMLSAELVLKPRNTLAKLTTYNSLGVRASDNPTIAGPCCRTLAVDAVLHVIPFSVPNDLIFVGTQQRLRTWCKQTPLV